MKKAPSLHIQFILARLFAKIKTLKVEYLTTDYKDFQSQLCFGKIDLEMEKAEVEAAKH